MNHPIAKKSLILLLSLFTALVVALCAFAPQTAYGATEGWKHDSKGFWYQYANGSYPRNTWMQIDDEEDMWVYFNKSGYAHEGWLKKGGKWYYCADILVFAKEYYDDASYKSLVDEGTKEGVVAKIGGKTRMIPLMINFGPYPINNNWYYFNNSGVMQTGWKKIDGDWCYFAGSGALQFGWVKSGGKWYFTDDNGIMQTGWLTTGGSKYYLSKSGAMVTGWQKISGKWYYFAKSGAMQTNKWVGNYYVQKDGTMAVNTWIGKYHVDKNGKWDKTK